MQLVQSISSALDNKTFSLSVFLDLTKTLIQLIIIFIFFKIYRHYIQDVLKWFVVYLTKNNLDQVIILI